ncbi:MAG: insulinase family protein [Oscillospiraceae bacterium]|nr:insulinase family protein [Oscillospiraceae bacterium]
MRKTKKWLSLLLALVIAFPGTAALADSFPGSSALTLQPGDELCGFTVTEVYNSFMLNSTIYTMTHGFSGAMLVYVKNDDPEVAFSIGYHTPYMDETDTNHVFEHAILAGSEKYPATNAFFDLANRAYSTYVNAHTDFTATWYPLSSMSEEQLIRMADVYMSCMVAPVVLTEENIFKREAVRLELDDPEGEIRINGTVFAEDTGRMTDWDVCHAANMLDALYPGEIASNMFGQAFAHVDNLTFEHTLETYERCYHFDNSLLYLYGDLDLERFLSFLDEEYLSKYPASGTDQSTWVDGPSAPGFVDVKMPMTAYEGDAVDRASVISYVVDLSGLTDVQINQYALLAEVFNQVGSPLYNLRLERSIQSPVYVAVYQRTAKPFIEFEMYYADPEQKDEFRQLVEDTLSQVAAEGVEPEILKMVVKAQELSTKLLRNNTNVGTDILMSFLNQWTRSGDPNFCRPMEQALSALCADGEQLIIRQMALDLLMPRRSALVTSVPEPGLAEEHDRALAEYLQDLKASLSPEELAAMVEETEAFNAWNADEKHNSDFLISPHDLPAPAAPAWTKENVDGVTVYRSDTSLEGVGSYGVCFDLSGMSREEMEALMMSLDYLLKMDTADHSASELYLLVGEYIADLGTQLYYPNESAGENHRPMLMIRWNALTEDFEKSLDLVLEMLTRTDFSNTEKLGYFTNMIADDWDMSRGSGYGISDRTAHANAGLTADTQKFQLDVKGQSCYDLFTEAMDRLAADAGFAAELAERYENASRKAFTKSRLIFLTAVSEKNGDAVVETAVRILNTLPEKEGADTEYTLPTISKSLAVCIEDSVMNTSMVGDYMEDPEFLGSYLPFYYAFQDTYVIPTLRFRLGAYGANCVYEWDLGTLFTIVYSDPNVKVSVDAMRAMPEAIREMQLTQEELDGYILKAYSKANEPEGVLDGVMEAMICDILGMDAERTLRIRSDVRNATLDQLAEAVEHIADVMKNSTLCTVGNEALIRADADCFDEIISYRHGE